MYFIISQLKRSESSWCLTTFSKFCARFRCWPGRVTFGASPQNILEQLKGNASSLQITRGFTLMHSPRPFFVIRRGMSQVHSAKCTRRNRLGGGGGNKHIFSFVFDFSYVRMYFFDIQTGLGGWFARIWRPASVPKKFCSCVVALP